MAQAMGSKEAQAALIDPFSAPEPAAETGLNAHFRSTFAPRRDQNAPAESKALNSNNPFKTHGRNDSGSSPPTKQPEARARAVSSASNGTGRERFPPYRGEAVGDFGDTPPRRSGSSSRRGGGHGTPPSYQEATSSNARASTRSRRASSLTARFPGDESHQPLDIIRRDSKRAHRSPHLHKKHMPGPDSIDKLDPAVGGRAYHHEGPYDAALMARNSSYKTAPLAALESSNREAIKATPRENIQNSIDRHVPLDGVAVVPPGVPDRLGRTYQYEEGTDMRREPVSDAGFKRWPGKDYSPEDLQGQSEPSFTLDRALRDHHIDDGGIEMEDRAAGPEHNHDQAGEAHSTAPRRHSSITDGLKRRIGSLRHKKLGNRDEE